ncbi:MAG: PCP reductase family protein [Nitrospira sp.]|nr:PCP reductase family protein [Nitrospira sp.]MCP9463562.1 PCP reductase family protein [Nitrospira sp.]
MHTQGIEELEGRERTPSWFVRLECRGCGFVVGVDVPAEQDGGLVDRLMWTDEALHRLDRMPPYVAVLVRPDVEERARVQGRRVITYESLMQLATDQQIEWESEAERRLENVPPAVRAMAKVELERTAAERGLRLVTVALMEEVKAKYFGMGIREGKA